MNFIYEKNTKKKEKLRIEDLRPGTIFELNNGSFALKISNSSDSTYTSYVVLTYPSGDDWFDMTDGSLDYHGIKKIHGHLTGLQIRR